MEKTYKIDAVALLEDARSLKEPQGASRSLKELGRRSGEMIQALRVKFEGRKRELLAKLAPTGEWQFDRPTSPA